MYVPLRTHSRGTGGLLMLPFPSWVPLQWHFISNNGTQSSGSRPRSGQGKGARKREILLIITKINCEAEARCHKAQV